MRVHLRLMMVQNSNLYGHWLLATGQWLVRVETQRTCDQQNDIHQLLERFVYCLSLYFCNALEQVTRPFTKIQVGLH